MAEPPIQDDGEPIQVLVHSLFRPRKDFIKPFHHSSGPKREEPGNYSENGHCKVVNTNIDGHTYQHVPPGELPINPRGHAGLRASLLRGRNRNERAQRLIEPTVIQPRQKSPERDSAGRAARLEKHGGEGSGQTEGKSQPLKTARKSRVRVRARVI